MAWNLTSNFSGGGQNGNRIVFGTFHFDDDNLICNFTADLKTTVGTNRQICHLVCYVADGISTVVSRQASPANNLNIDDSTYYFIQSTRSTPTGYTDMKTAERAATNTPAGRRTACEAHLFSAGHFDPVSLAGS